MKRAILIVSNGTSAIEAFNASIGKVEERIRDEFKEYEIFRAFSSEKIISKLKKNHNVLVYNPLEALSIIESQGFNEVIIEPLFIVNGVEYYVLRSEVDAFKKNSKLKNIILGNTILKYNDESRAMDLVEHLKDSFDESTPTVFMAHGTKGKASKCYIDLENAFKSCGLSNIYIGAAEGEPSITEVIKCLHDKNVTEVLLRTFLIVAGYHAKKDLYSSEPMSWKSILQEEGINVLSEKIGLGEIQGFQDFIIEDLAKLISSNRQTK